MSKSGTLLSLMVCEVGLCVDDAFYGVIKASKENDEDKVKELTREYEREREMQRFGILMAASGLENWDWKWLADNGDLSRWDWKEFGAVLENAGVSKEEYDKKWNIKEG